MLVTLERHGCKDCDAFLTCFDEASKGLPSVEACDLACFGSLRHDQEHIAKAVFVEPGHDSQELLELLAVPCFEGGAECLDLLFDECFCFFCFHILFLQNNVSACNRDIPGGCFS